MTVAAAWKSARSSTTSGRSLTLAPSDVGSEVEPALNGALEVEVEGLVLVNTGANPQAAFRAVVACHTIVDGQATTARDVTGPFPATPQGDSKIEAQVSVPSPCFDPAVFVTTGAGDPPRWFAVTGH